MKEWHIVVAIFTLAGLMMYAIISRQPREFFCSQRADRYEARLECMKHQSCMLTPVDFSAIREFEAYCPTLGKSAAHQGETK